MLGNVDIKNIIIGSITDNFFSSQFELLEDKNKSPLRTFLAGSKHSEIVK